MNTSSIYIEAPLIEKYVSKLFYNDLFTIFEITMQIYQGFLSDCVEENNVECFICVILFMLP